VNYGDVITFAQGHFSDGLTIVVGSGLSAAEGVPGMGPLADYLAKSTADLPPGSAKWWSDVDGVLHAGGGLESALLRYAPSDAQEQWIRRKTTELLVPYERRIISEAIIGTRGSLP
jgi:hypothetical protein